MTGRKKQGTVPETTGVAGCSFASGAPSAVEHDKQAPALRFESTITCPECSSPTRARMPTDACQYFWDCPACGAVLKPKPGDCCVFCSWGDVACPPLQVGRDCCR